jgi:magnesium chelatase family protein
MRIGSALSIGLVGLNAFFIQVQAFVSPGLPYFSIIGLPDTSLSEARERVKAAASAIGFPWPQTRVTVNLSPASLPKRGAMHDLSLAVAIMNASGALPSANPESTLVLGELNLDGSILPINGVLPILLFAKEHGITNAIIPQANCAEAELVGDINVHGVRHLSEVVRLLGGTCAEHPLETDASRSAASGQAGKNSASLIAASTSAQLTVSAAPTGDMSEVLGQSQAKRSLEVAAAGGHHVLMSGPPGSGKTMLASRLPSIMPELSEQEALEVASIRSLCGTLPRFGLSATPPFEAPHHTASSAALAGGGSGIAQPGAITRAHAGVLFLDEAPEFSSRSLQILREPLETGVVTLSRSKSVTMYPARFLLVMAANPCPCGNYWGKAENCTCSVRERMRYMSRLSGPLLDRIDIQIDVPPVNSLIAGTHQATESSAAIRSRVVAARASAQARYADFGWGCNALASGQWLRANTDSHALAPISRALEDHRISLRGADRTLRLAWTIADLSGHITPTLDDVVEGISMRTRK